MSKKPTFLQARHLKEMLSASDIDIWNFRKAVIELCI